ncbi:hypothetical protein CASFOL_004531 [Castilleja foliolosa]|uniref:ATP-dependent DNA helicase n=1 Tax=Castilleja foliolosa TaxID=1961234 RepID=A0ABD3EET1_9LAMI
MPPKRKFDSTAFEVGQSTRRLPNRVRVIPVDTLLPYTYFDDGDCEYICEHCAAFFWFAERIVRGPLHARPRHTHCFKNGSVRLPPPLDPPPAIRALFEDSNFMENVRAYNNMFSMTSFGARVDDAVNNDHGPYVFKVSGQVSHWIGSICPPDNEHPRFLQLYIYDTENEVPNRMRFFGSSDHHSISPSVVRSLCDTLSVRLYNNVGDHRYEPPASGTLGGIVYADDPNACKYDVVVRKKGGQPQRVSKLHPSYIPLQYPLLFPFAEPGWSPSLKLHSVSEGRRQSLTVNMYYSFQIHDRHNVYSLLLKGGRLFQQYLVDAYTCIEQSRLDFVNANQNIFRSEFVAGLYDALAKGDNNAHDIGKRVFLPSSFTGGPRYMYKHYQDALAICRVFGNPQYFITFTCNVKWPEISRHLDKVGGAQAQNRPDIISRVFRIKVQQFLRFMRSAKIFGEITADKISDAGDVDKFISAEIPDPSTDPLLYKIAIVRNSAFGKTTLTEWLESNKRDPGGLHLTYVNYCSEYWWCKIAVTWIRRARLQNPAIGRLAYVHPTSGLLGEDREWLTVFEESSSWATSSELRTLFVHMLLFCDVSQSLYFWETQWKRMADDIRLRLASEISRPQFFLNDADLQESILLNLEKLLNTATPLKSLSDFGLPLPSTSALASVGNRLLLEETCYDRPSLAYEHGHSLSMLNSDQRQVYDCILSSYHTNSQVLLFVYGHGGTGKTFLWRTIISFFRSIGKVVLAVAASGIASLLLPSGRTAHSRFKIPLDLTELSTCHIKKGTHLADLKETLLVIWDEAPMSDRRCFECLDKTLRDITNNAEHPFGGKSILLGGDFRQTLPVKVKCTRSEIIDATLPRSYLWRHFRIFELHENMRLKAHTDNIELSGDASEFASWLLQIGDGLFGDPDINDMHNTRLIKIPAQYLIQAADMRLKSLIHFIYDISILNNPSPEILSTRAIVCPTNETCDEINKLVLTLTPGECRFYKSHDVMTPHGVNEGDLEPLYPQEYLNQLTFPGIRPH